jgi:DNA helicase-2/ATP-dependent DNA helicase PcrA
MGEAAVSNHSAATPTFRREMLSAMRTALKIAISGENVHLTDALWQVQNKIRHIGRHIAYRSVGSALLVKGL